MHSLLAMAASAALMLPFLGSSGASEASNSASSNAEPAPSSQGAETERANLPAHTNLLDAVRQSDRLAQVRIQQRVTIRIAPRRSQQRQNLLAEMPPRGQPTQVEERDIGECLVAEDIAAVQTDRGSRLLLFLNDRRIVSVNLEKSCRARDFYAGFYMERNEDGKLCVDRDTLQSRSGAKCEIERIRQLVAVSDD